MIFDPKAQISNPDLKIIASFERLGEAFRVLVWEKAKILGISPIQIQILIFVKFHNNKNCKVSYLAKEFCVTKPTISEAVKSLEQKGYIRRLTESTDTRSHTIHLTESGDWAVAQSENFANSMLSSVAKIPFAEKSVLLEQLLGVIAQLQQSGIISMQRMCYSCRYYQKNAEEHFCKFLNTSLQKSELRVDCEEYEAVE